MMLSRLFERIADDRAPSGALESALQGALTAAAPLYAAGAFLNRFMHDAGLARRESLPATVFSVGNLTVGGTGKTPFCVWLVDWLREQNRKAAIVTRGYGREDEDRLVLVHNGRKLAANARQAGDEPVLLATLLGDVPVVACADRHRAGRLALRKFEIDTIVLDDGFQHHDLERQADIVLVDATRPLSSLKLLPRGTLRESPGVLSRAHLVVLTRCTEARDVARAYRDIRRVVPSVPVVRTTMVLGSARRLCSGESLDMTQLRGKKAVVVCGVGNPDSVRRNLEECGVEVLHFQALRDHATASSRLIGKAERRRKKRKADFVIVTEKDAVKIDDQAGLPESVVSIQSRIEFVSGKDRALAEKVLKSRLHARLVKGYLS